MISSEAARLDSYRRRAIADAILMAPHRPGRRPGSDRAAGRRLAGGCSSRCVVVGKRDIPFEARAQRRGTHHDDPHSRTYGGASAKMQSHVLLEGGPTPRRRFHERVRSTILGLRRTDPVGRPSRSMIGVFNITNVALAVRQRRKGRTTR